ncbi:MAG: hypothetical protein AAGG75_00600 [Bacteroidota bacterium]
MKEQFLHPRYPDLPIVRRAAKQFILLRQKVSPLEIRNYLRKQGYIAYKSDICYLMACVAEEESWRYYHEAGQRVYHFAPDEAAACLCESIGFSSN